MRSFDGQIGAWTTPDAYSGEVDDPMSQKSYVWNRNNAVAYSDPSGHEATSLTWDANPQSGSATNDVPDTETWLEIGGVARRIDSPEAQLAAINNVIDPLNGTYANAQAAAQAASAKFDKLSEKLGVEIGCEIYCNANGTACGYTEGELGSYSGVPIGVHDFSPIHKQSAGTWHSHPHSTDPGSLDDHNTDMTIRVLDMDHFKLAHANNPITFTTMSNGAMYKQIWYGPGDMGPNWVLIK